MKKLLEEYNEWLEEIDRKASKDLYSAVMMGANVLLIGLVFISAIVLVCLLLFYNFAVFGWYGLITLFIIPLAVIVYGFNKHLKEVENEDD